jgi:predicted nucleic acid-binding Zn ribbon protein
MPKYEYETIDEKGQVLRRFEIWQGINEPALERDPETGEKVRRIISRTSYLGSKSSDSSAANVRGHSCAGACGCKH